MLIWKRTGHMTPIWNDSYKDFDFVKQPLKQSEIIAWQDKGYYHESFSGGMYDSRNPMPEWVDKVSQELALTKCGYVFYKMSTLDIMPQHSDHFETYERVFGVTRENTVRALVFLEDWKPGHYFEFDGASRLPYIDAVAVSFIDGLPFDFKMVKACSILCFCFCW